MLQLHLCPLILAMLLFSRTPLATPHTALRQPLPMNMCLEQVIFRELLASRRQYCKKSLCALVSRSNVRVLRDVAPACGTWTPMRAKCDQPGDSRCSREGVVLLHSGIVTCSFGYLDGRAPHLVGKEGSQSLARVCLVEL